MILHTDEAYSHNYNYSFLNISDSLIRLILGGVIVSE